MSRAPNCCVGSHEEARQDRKALLRALRRRAAFAVQNLLWRSGLEPCTCAVARTQAHRHIRAARSCAPVAKSGHSASRGEFATGVAPGHRGRLPAARDLHLDNRGSRGGEGLRGTDPQ